MPVITGSSINFSPNSNLVHYRIAVLVAEGWRLDESNLTWQHPQHSGYCGLDEAYRIATAPVLHVPPVVNSHQSLQPETGLPVVRYLDLL